MNVLERLDWQSAADLNEARGEPFVTLDPGVKGAAIGWGHSGRSLAFCHALDPLGIAAALAGIRGRVLIVERQFVPRAKPGKDNHGQVVSVVELAFRSGLSLGVVAAALRQRRETLRLFEVAPAVWQGAQRRRLGKRGRVKRGDGIKLALEVAERVLGDSAGWLEASASEREGLASAYGIGQWWREL